MYGEMSHMGELCKKCMVKYLGVERDQRCWINRLDMSENELDVYF